MSSDYNDNDNSDKEEVFFTEEEIMRSMGFNQAVMRLNSEKNSPKIETQNLQSEEYHEKMDVVIGNETESEASVNKLGLLKTVNVLQQCDERTAAYLLQPQRLQDTVLNDAAANYEDCNSISKDENSSARMPTLSSFDISTGEILPLDDSILNTMETLIDIDLTLVDDVGSVEVVSTSVAAEDLTRPQHDAMDEVTSCETDNLWGKSNESIVDERSDIDDPNDLDYTPPGIEEDLHNLDVQPGSPITAVGSENCGNEENHTSKNTETSDNDLPVNGELQNSQNRKRKDESQWQKVVSKKLRMSGKAYLGYRRTKDGKIYQDQQREERKMGPTCKSNMCKKSNLRGCNTINDEQRLNLFQTFWEKMNWDQRRVYLVNMIEKTSVRRRTVEEDESRRGETLKYHFLIDGKRIQVCKLMFLHTLGIKNWTVRYWLSENKQVSGIVPSGMVSSSGITRPSKENKRKNDSDIEFAKSFLNSLAKLPSHYCRKSTSRLYLEPIVISMSHLHDLYKGKCTENRRTSSLSRFTFDKIFDEMNLSLFQPKKDKCDVCCSYDVGNITEETYNEHHHLKDSARNEKQTDKEKAVETKTCHVFTQDLQAVKLVPFLNASAVYYKTKLNVHNFTIYNLATKDVVCYWFDETAAQLVASTFASCIIHTLKALLSEDLKPVVLWSDGCGYQNRNAVLSNALLHLAREKNVVIEQKFLVKGHTQMECDSVHSAIETQLKKREIYLPSQYSSLTKEARKRPFPYKSLYLTHAFFKDFSDKATMAYDSIRPGRVASDSKVHDIRALRYNPNGQIDFKTDFTSDYSPLPRRPKPVDCITDFPRLYKERLKISTAKWKHLQELKEVIPADCYPFYDTLLITFKVIKSSDSDLKAVLDVPFS